MISVRSIWFSEAPFACSNQQCGATAEFAVTDDGRTRVYCKYHYNQQLARASLMGKEIQSKEPARLMFDCAQEENES
jgi:hypothetical protein